MPAEMERALRAQANKHKSWSKERKNRYIYGTMIKSGNWRPSRWSKKAWDKYRKKKKK
mgnify:CR=1 FL=1